MCCRSYFRVFEGQDAFTTLKVTARQSRLVNGAPVNLNFSISPILAYNRQDSVSDALLYKEPSLLEHYHSRL